MADALTPALADTPENQPAPTKFGWEAATGATQDQAPSVKKFSFEDAMGKPAPDLATQAGITDADQISQQQPPDWAREAFGHPGTILSPEAQEKMDAIQRQGGWRGAMAGLGSTAAEDVGVAGGVMAGLGNVGFAAAQRGVQQAGEYLGAPKLGRDIAAMPEAFMGMPEALGVHPPGSPEAIHADVAKAKEVVAQTRAAAPPPEPTGGPAPSQLPHVQAARQQLDQIARGEQPAETPPPPPPTATPQPAAAPEAQVQPPAAQVQPPKATGNPASDFVMMRPSDLKVDPERFQFKASDEKGVTGALQGVTKWEPALANPLTAWQSDAGDTFVVNGHQRHDLGTRAEAAGQDVQMPVRIYREADGYTPDFMRVLGAYQNIAEGSGSPIDIAKVLRGKDSIPTNMVLPQLPPKSEAYRQAQSLAKLAPNAFGMVENGIVAPAHATSVGDLITDPKQQEAALSMLAKSDVQNVNQARLIVQDVRDSGFLQGTQGGLFGDEDFAKSLIPERAKILDGSMSSLRRTRGLYKAAVEGEEELTAAGNQLNPEANLKAKTGNEQLIDLISKGATLKGPISDALSAAARDFATGKPKATAQAAFLAAVRQIIGRGEDTGVEPSGVYGGEGLAEPPGLGGRRLPTPPTTGADLFGGEGKGPAQRATPEPTIKSDQRQQAFEGMEATAKQAQAARNAAGPRGNQLPADQGLFGRPETPQPELAPPTSRFAQYAGRTFRDLLPTVPDRMGGHAGAERWVLDQGKKTGNEHMAIVDNKTGEIVHAGTNDHPSFMEFDPSGHQGEEDAYTIHHNHPMNGALSGPDTGMLSWPHMSDLVAHGHGGDMFSATIGQGVRDVRTAEPGMFLKTFNAMKQSYDRVYEKAFDIVTDLMAGGQEFNDPNRVALDAINRILHNQGFINLSTTRELPKAVADAVDKEYPNVDPRREAGTLVKENRLAGLQQPVGRVAEDANGPAGPANDQGSVAAQPARTGEPRLAEGEGSKAGLGAPAAPTPQPQSPVRRIAERIADFGRTTRDDVTSLIAPMAVGSKRAQAAAFSFANSLRNVVYSYGKIDEHVVKNYNPAMRDAMGRAMDNQSVFEQQLADTDPATWAAQRAQFDQGGTGVAGLPPKARAVVDTLANLGQQVWQRMQARGMVGPGAQGLPYYFTRQMIARDEEGNPIRAGSGSGGVRDIQQIGRNVTTTGPMRREHLTPEESEAAAKAAMGPGTFLLRDIRSVINGLSRNERAVAGTDLIQSIEKVGKDTGVNLVVKGDIPGMLQPGDYFTMNHPAFRTWTGSGFRDLHVSTEFEGPIRSVLTTKTGALYNSMMQAKSGVMHAIMYSPFMHLAVELGRSLPVMPGKIITLQALRDGSRTPSG